MGRLYLLGSDLEEFLVYELEFWLIFSTNKIFTIKKLYSTILEYLAIELIELNAMKNKIRKMTFFILSPFINI